MTVGLTEFHLGRMLHAGVATRSYAANPEEVYSFWLESLLSLRLLPYRFTDVYLY